ncbi:MAG: beta-galactosidase [Planctomycetes bacterium]|nr:beta-galactosidase [Planctomycetota bacterium]
MKIRNLFTLTAILLLSTIAYAAETTEALSITQQQLQYHHGATASIADNTITLAFDDPRASMKIVPPDGQGTWDWSKWKYISVDIKNKGESLQLRLNMQLTSQQGRRKDSVIGIALNPGEKRTLVMRIPHPFYNRSPERDVPAPRSIDTDKIVAVEFFMQWSYEPNKSGLVNCELSNIHLAGTVEGDKGPMKEGFFPFVDRYGQYAHEEWPEKIHSPEDMVKNRIEEEKELATVKRPSQWNKYGGWKNGPKLKATGYFRVEKYQGKWWFVDPEGKLFFSQGIDVLYPHTDSTSVNKHEKWFENGNDGRKSLPFTDDNLKLKYGKEDYHEEFFTNLTKRMLTWGINSAGNWGSNDFLVRSSMPYTMQLSDFRNNLPRIGKLKFNDVYDQKYVEAMKNLISEASKKSSSIAKSLKDPMCIGYFIDNEIRFGNWHKDTYHVALVDEVVKCKPSQAAKQEWAKDLEAKYETIAKLNEAWNTSYASWDELLQSTSFPPRSDALEEDSMNFLKKTAERYFQLCNDAIKTAAPHRLYLGCRFLSTESVEPVVSAACAKYCDVMTVNIYSHTPANFPVDNFVDMPVLVGEFHFGVYDRGLFSPGLCWAGVTQQDRAIAYTRFVQAALVHPNIVGTHWFQFRDQPLTGRWDGEGYQIGFVDVADTPYPEMTRAAREIGENMYQYRTRGLLVNPMK